MPPIAPEVPAPEHVGIHAPLASETEKRKYRSPFKGGFRAGIHLVCGDFGTGKTFFTHASVTGLGTNDTVRIGNYVSPDFHLQFRSLDDLVRVLKAIYDFKKDPANFARRFVVVVDEAPLYFNSRDFKYFPKEILPFLVQLRKLNVSFIAICQDLRMLDVNFRRLCSSVTEYEKKLGLFYVSTRYRLLTEDATNLKDETRVERKGSSFHFWPSWIAHARASVTDYFPKATPYFGSSRYDTHELILPLYDVLDERRLAELCPYTVRIEDSGSYKVFLADKLGAALRELPESIRPFFEEVTGFVATSLSET